MFGDVIIDLSVDSLDRTFQYRIPPELEDSLTLGSRVVVPFGAQTKNGYLVGLSAEAKVEPERIRDILGPAKRAVPVSDRAMKLAAWMKERYGCTMNQALKAVLPAKAAVRKGHSRVEAVPLPEEGAAPVTLTEEQERALREIREEMDGKRRPVLLFGVTGSGKTEIYMELIAEQAAAGRQSILLIPEIGLTYQNLRRFYRRFGDRVGVINSRQSEGEKYENSEKARKGEIDLIIGPRSALFAPMPHLGLIIIDEAHDDAYRSEFSPRYHAPEVAAKLAELSGAALVLGSATPSVESFRQAETGAVRLVRLARRAVPGSVLPEVHVTDLREELESGNKSIFSRLLREKMEERLAKGEQTMLFLNRRGYAGFVSCRSCGEALKCPHCDISLTYHRNQTLVCHYCGYRRPFPDRCPSCGSPYVAAFGTGTQKVETLVQKEFPGARVLRMDADTTAGKGGHSRILEAFSKEDADILVGTQMIVKGHDFPKVTLVGILAADLSLYAQDFRAAERTFELLTQAAGRAGRSGLPGEVVIQTYRPEHYAIRAAAGQDYEGFYREEMAYRRLLKYPPAGSLLAVTVSSTDPEDAVRRTLVLKEELKGQFPGAEWIGPGEGTGSKLKDVYRLSLYVKSGDPALLLRIRDAAERYFPEHVQGDLL